MNVDTGAINLKAVALIFLSFSIRTTVWTVVVKPSNETLSKVILGYQVFDWVMVTDLYLSVNLFWGLSRLLVSW